MKKMSKRSLNAVLALLMALNLSGCSLFGGDDEDDAKETSTTKNDGKDDNKDKDKNNDDGKKDKDNEDQKDEIDEDDESIHYTGGYQQPYVPSYPSEQPSQDGGTNIPDSPSKSEVVVKVDFTQLHTLIVEYKDMNVSVYTPRSVSSFKTALAHAEKVLNTTNASQKTVNQEVKLLKQAKEKLVKLADFTKLNDSLEKAKTIEADLYTPISIQNLNNAIALGKNVYDDKNSSQIAVDQAAIKMNQAIENLVKRADFTVLNAIVEKARAIKDADYTDASLSPMYMSLKQAENVLKNKNASQKAVDEATKDLQSKLDSLVAYVAPDTSELKQLINQAKTYKENEWSTASYSELSTSIQDAENAIQIQKVTQTQIQAVKEKLQKAIDGLTVDVSILNTQLTKAKEIDEIQYTPSSYALLKQAITDTENFLSGTHKQYEIDAQTKQLSSAINQLVKRADKKELQKAIDNAKATYTGDYTEITMNALKQAVIDAEAIVNNLNATQEQVSNATKTVKDATANLKLVIHKEKLQEAINKTKNVKEDEFTPITYAPFKIAYEQAIKTNDNEDATQEQVNACTNALESTFAKLVERANLTALNQKIIEAEAINQDDYTDASLITFNKELNEAKELVKNLNATQDEVDAKLSSLSSAISSLVAYVAPNMDAISQAISDAEKVNKDDWSISSYDAMKNKLNIAKQMVDKKKVSQEEIDKAKDELLSAYNALNVDLSSLNETLKNAKSYQEVNYTLDSFKVLTDAITHTEDFLKTSHTQSEINSERSSLQSAIDQLTLFHEADKTTLTKAINDAKALNENQYTPNSYSPFKDAITKAETVKDKYRATVEEINNAINELDVAKSNLVIRADVTKLNQAITEAKEKYSQDYTNSSLNALKQVVSDAESVINNANASQNEVNMKVNEVTTAISNLVKLGDKVALSNLINELDALQESDYTPVSWVSASLGTIIENAKIILNKQDATETEVNNELDALSQAKAKLVKKADITELESEITIAKAEAMKDYTTQTLKTLNDAIANAETVVSNPNATAQEVSNALNSIKTAISGLIKNADKTGLETLLNEVKDYAESDYTPSTWKTFKDAKDSANDVMSNRNATQLEVENATLNLTNAKDGLIKKASKTALNEAITNAEDKINNGNYTTETLNIVNEKLVSAKELANNENATQSDVDTMTKELNDAVTALKVIVNTDNLTAKIAEAKNINKDIYTNDSYAELQKAITDAENLLKNENKTQDAVDKATESITKAMNELIEVPSVSSKHKELENVVAEADALLTDSSMQGPSNIKKALEERVTVAKDFLDDPIDEVTIEDLQQQIDIVKAHMQNYKDNLYDVEGLITMAKAKLAEFKALNPDDYSSASYNTAKFYADMLEERVATGIYNDIKNAYDWLTEEMSDLEPKDHNIYVNEQAPSEVLALLNAERKAQGLGELTLDPTLCQATTIRATEADQQNGDFADWAHKRPDGRAWSTVLGEVGINPTVRGENAARGQASGESLYNAWYSSEGHRNNMMDSRFTKIGISMVKVGEGTWVSYMILSN